MFSIKYTEDYVELVFEIYKDPNGNSSNDFLMVKRLKYTLFEGFITNIEDKFKLYTDYYKEKFNK